MSIQYGWEKFRIAADILVGSGAVQQRLASAYLSALMPLREDHVPRDIWPRLKKLRDDMASEVPRGNEGSIKAFCNSLSDEQAGEYAREILSMYDAVARSYGTRT